MQKLLRKIRRFDPMTNLLGRRTIELYLRSTAGEIAEEEEKRVLWGLVWLALFLILAGAFLTLIPLLWPLIFAPILPYVQSLILKHPWLKLPALMILVLVGIWYFYIRLRRRTTYGIGEFIIGTFTCWVALENIASIRSGEQAMRYTLPVAAGLYVMVRGCDNIYSSYKELLDKQDKQQREVREWQIQNEERPIRDQSGFLLDLKPNSDPEQH